AKALIASTHEGTEKARDKLVENAVRRVCAVGHRFSNCGYELEDVVLIGSIGLRTAIDKVDLLYDVTCSTYAGAMIIREIQRFIRDDGTVKVSRTIKELANKLRAAREELTKEFSRSPTVNEVADYLDITPEEAAQAQEATKYPHSIYETVY